MVGNVLMLLLADAAAPQPKPTASPQSWLRSKDYPVSALIHDREGVTDFELQVDETGHPVSCRITLSSGDAELDAATCKGAQAHALFEPVRDASGKAVPSTFASRAIWEADGPRVYSNGIALNTLEISANGTVTHCDIRTDGRVAPRIVWNMRTACDMHSLPAGSAALRLAPRYKTLRIRIAYSVDEGPVPDFDSSLGDVIYRRVSDIAVDKKWGPLSCTLTISVGSDWPYVPMCERNPALLKTPTREDAVAHTFREDSALFGTPR